MNEVDRGVIYVAIGKKSEYEASMSKTSLNRQDEIETVVIKEKPKGEWSDKQASRILKIDLFSLVPWHNICYLDADTRPQTSILVGFDILDDGYDLVVTPSNNQGNDAFWHIPEDERKYTLEKLGNCDFLQYQAGVFWVTRNDRTVKFMEAWKIEWQEYKDEDQGAFVRALARVPIKIWLLGYPWNGGALIQHRWGATR